jgi:hypothetical protein
MRRALLRYKGLRTLQCLMGYEGLVEKVQYSQISRSFPRIIGGNLTPLQLPGKLEKQLQYGRIELSKWWSSEPVMILGPQHFDEVVRRKGLKVRTTAMEWDALISQWVAINSSGVHQSESPF